MAKVEVYTTTSCPYCSRAKDLLKRKGIPYQEVVIGMDDDAAWDALSKRSGMQTVPQIFADGTLIGGYTELAALDARDGLRSLV